MVHALREAHRVLKPAGLLIDLRPSAAHRQVGILCAGRCQPLGVVHRNVDDVRAANRAVARIVRAGLFKIEWRVRFDCNRIMDTPEEFQAWWDEFAHMQLDDSVLRKIENAFTVECKEKKIVVKMPLALLKLRKAEDAAL
ncbi:hypothetical protein DCC62_28055 [candidate division KSB1 bacterium]|nr:MAG: hypothetical protein DCC62_28055 [candidate division KSB1 bacterium]